MENIESLIEVEKELGIDFANQSKIIVADDQAINLEAMK